MADRVAFQEQVKKLGELVARFEEMPAGPEKAAGKELLQLLMDVQAQGLERVMEMIFESRETGPGLIDQLGKDDVAGGLLLLYSLHPDAFEARVETAVERLQSHLRKLSCAIELLAVEEGAVRVRVAKGGHGCGSSTDELRSTVENGILELAPDLVSLEILGLAEPTGGFVALETLTTGTARNGNGRLAEGVR